MWDKPAKMIVMSNAPYWLIRLTATKCMRFREFVQFCVVVNNLIKMDYCTVVKYTETNKKETHTISMKESRLIEQNTRKKVKFYFSL